MVAMLLPSQDDGQGGRDASEYPAFGSSQTLVGQMPLLFWAKMPLFIDDFVRGGDKIVAFLSLLYLKKKRNIWTCIFKGDNVLTMFPSIILKMGDESRWRGWWPPW